MVRGIRWCARFAREPPANHQHTSGVRNGSVMVREWFDFATRRVPQLQVELMKDQSGRGVTVAFVKGDEEIADPAERNVQRPRVFYRREVEAQPLVVAKPK